MVTEFYLWALVSRLLSIARDGYQFVSQTKVLVIHANMFPHQMVIWLLESVGYPPRRECWKWSCWGQNCWLSMAAAFYDVFCMIILMHMLGVCSVLEFWFCSDCGGATIYFCPSMIMGRAREWRIMLLSIIWRAPCRVLFYCFIVGTIFYWNLE